MGEGGVKNKGFEARHMQICCVGKISEYANSANKTNKNGWTD